MRKQNQSETESRRRPNGKYGPHDAKPGAMGNLEGPHKFLSERVAALDRNFEDFKRGATDYKTRCMFISAVVKDYIDLNLVCKVFSDLGLPEASVIPILEALDVRKGNIGAALKCLSKWATNENVDALERHYYNTLFQRLWDRWAVNEARDYYLANAAPLKGLMGAAKVNLEVAL